MATNKPSLPFIYILIAIVIASNAASLATVTKQPVTIASIHRILKHRFNANIII